MPKFADRSVDLSGLMEKLSADYDKYKPGVARIKVREGSSFNADELMKGLADRTDEIIAQHEAEREAKREREESRKRLHPDQYEEMEQKKNGHI